MSPQFPHLAGDLELPPKSRPLHRARFVKLLTVLDAAARDMNVTMHVNSGYRSYAEQARLYAAYQAGTGALAAKPGTSNHNKGRAADVSVGINPVGSSFERRKVLARHGLCLPVFGEKWHVERGNTWNAAPRPTE